MSGSASLDLERLMLGHTLAIAPMPTLARVYVALCQTAPTEAAGGSELAGGGYARSAATFALLATPANAASNATAVDFAPATGDWRPISHFELWTAATGGTRLYWGQLVDPADGMPVEIDVLSGSAVRFSPGSLVVQAAEINATGIGPFLPTAGGEMFGALDYIATGATVVRSLQDTSADVANVLNYGADPTGVADSTTAIQAAVATGKRVYIPQGRYIVTDAITITTGQIIEGDGRSATLLMILGGFNMIAAGVFVFAVSAGEQGPEIRDLWIRYSQPSFAGVARADMIHYPPAINTSGSSSRFKLVNVYITNAWDGIVFNGGGAGFIDRLEMSAYHIGIEFGTTAPVLDAQRVENFHFWVFDLSLDQRLVMNDGQTVAAQIGRVDELIASNWSIIQSLINVTDTAGTGGYYMFSNLHLDGPQAQLNIVNPFVFHCVNMFYSKNNTVETPAINVSGGNATFHNLSSQSSMATSPCIRVTGGIVMFAGGNTWAQQSTTAEHVSVTGGKCIISDVDFGSHFPAHTVPIIHQSGTGVLVVKGCTFSTQFTSGVAIQMDTDSAGHMVQDNALGALTFTPPGPLGQYQNRGAFYTAPVTAGTFVAGSATATSAALRSHATAIRTIELYDTNILRWAAGNNNTDDWALARYDAAGAFVSNAYTVSWATGLMTVPSLAATALSSPAITVTTLTITTGGPTFRAGTGAPTGTHPRGSQWTRTDGAAGTTLYISQGAGSWLPVAGV
jgi:hypothetical protein